MTNIKIQAVAVTVSDRCARGETEDRSGAVLVKLLEEIGAVVVEKIVVADDLEPLADTLRLHAERGDINLIVTTGGTGFARRDNTPEATRLVITREAPGLAEAMRMRTVEKTPTAILSRAVCGIRGNCLIVNLPGAPKGVEECFDVIKSILPHALKQLAGIKEH